MQLSEQNRHFQGKTAFRYFSLSSKNCLPSTSLLGIVQLDFHAGKEQAWERV